MSTKYPADKTEDHFLTSSNVKCDCRAGILLGNEYVFFLSSVVFYLFAFFSIVYMKNSENIFHEFLERDLGELPIRAVTLYP